jgi:hypothetical protein
MAGPIIRVFRRAVNYASVLIYRARMTAMISCTGITSWFASGASFRAGRRRCPRPNLRLLLMALSGLVTVAVSCSVRRLGRRIASVNGAVELSGAFAGVLLCGDVFCRSCSATLDQWISTAFSTISRLCFPGVKMWCFLRLDGQITDWIKRSSLVGLCVVLCPRRSLRRGWSRGPRSGGPVLSTPVA